MRTKADLDGGDRARRRRSGCGRRLMTVTAAFVGLLPIMVSQGTGADMMKRVAAPMIGGLTDARSGAGRRVPGGVFDVVSGGNSLPFARRDGSKVRHWGDNSLSAHRRPAAQTLPCSALAHAALPRGSMNQVTILERGGWIHVPTGSSNAASRNPTLAENEDRKSTRWWSRPWSDRRVETGSARGFRARGLRRLAPGQPPRMTPIDTRGAGAGFRPGLARRSLAAPERPRRVHDDAQTGKQSKSERPTSLRALPRSISSTTLVIHRCSALSAGETPE